MFHQMLVSITSNDSDNDDDRRSYGIISWKTPILVGLKQVMFIAILLSVFNMLIYIIHLQKKRYKRQ